MDLQGMSVVDSIASSGGFVSTKVVPREVSWSWVDPESAEQKSATITAHYADLSAGVVRDIFRSDAAGRDERFLSAILRNADGTTGITVEQAAKLRASALSALVAAGLDVIGMGDDAGKAEKKTSA